MPGNSVSSQGMRWRLVAISGLVLIIAIGGIVLLMSDSPGGTGQAAPPAGGEPDQTSGDVDDALRYAENICPHSVTSTLPTASPESLREEPPPVPAVPPPAGWTASGESSDGHAAYAAYFSAVPHQIIQAEATTHQVLQKSDGVGFATISYTTGPPTVRCFMLRSAAAGSVPTVDVASSRWENAPSVPGPRADDVGLVTRESHEWVTRNDGTGGTGQRFVISEIRGVVVQVYGQDVSLEDLLALGDLASTGLLPQ